MKFKAILLSMLLASTMSYTTFSNANDTAVKTMATIMLQFNHFPSEAQQSVLLELTNDSSVSDSEKLLATAILNIKHQASAVDKKKLSRISSDDSESSELRDLARVVRDINHTVGASDKEKLAVLAH